MRLQRHCPVLLMLVIGIRCLLAAEPASQPITPGQRICTTTHSFGAYVPQMLAELAAKAGIAGHEQIATSVIGGSFVSQHWKAPTPEHPANKVKQIVTAGKEDVLVLSPIYLPDDGIASFARLAFEHNPNVRVVVQESWLPWDVFDPTVDKGMSGWMQRQRLHPKVDHNAAKPERLWEMSAEYDKQLTECLQGLNQEFGRQVMYVVPAGVAVVSLREKVVAGHVQGIKTQQELFCDDLGHPSPPLQALVTYCYFGVIYRRTPVGLPKPTMLQEWPDDTNRVLQETAWTAVCQHPLSGVKP
jgi:hypothetical protein